MYAYYERKVSSKEETLVFVREAALFFGFQTSVALLNTLHQVENIL